MQTTSNDTIERAAALTVLLDVTGWPVVQCGGGWRHVNHALRLATSHWGTAEAAKRNERGYRDDAGTRQIMTTRYAALFEDRP